MQTREHDGERYEQTEKDKEQGRTMEMSGKPMGWMLRKSILQFVDGKMMMMRW
jgi:hypothetical protein